MLFTNKKNISGFDERRTIIIDPKEMNENEPNGFCMFWQP